MVAASRKARATRFAAVGELAALSKAQASLLAYGKTRQDLAVNGLQKTSHSAASTEKEQSLTFSLNYDA